MKNPVKNFIIKYYPILINIYTIWILYMMFFDFSRSVEGLEYEIHYIPFQSINQMLNDYLMPELIRNIGGNMILFIPYGFLGILYPKLNKYKYLFITFFISINYLEFSQYYFSRGFAEFDDVMMNCFGMSIGFLMYKKLLK